MKPYKFILSGGGTGGHIYPAIAIANELLTVYPDCKILFVGALGKMEMEKVPQAGFPIKGLWIAGLQRKQFWRNLLFPLKIIVSFFQATWILLRFRPHVAIGTGGFASGPLLYVAGLLKVKTWIQEQNSFAGITNKLLAKGVEGVAVAYDNMERHFPIEKIHKTGNPVRSNLIAPSKNKAALYAKYNLSSQKKIVLVVGGSLGSQKINEIIAEHLPFFKSQNVQLLWQCGALYYKRYKHLEKDGVRIFSFIKQMDEVYCLADMILSRAGAGAIAELAIVGKPTVLIPSPNVAEDHQKHNALSLVKKKAVLMIEEKEASKQFTTLFEDLFENPALQDELKKNLKAQALPEATKTIVSLIQKTLS